MRESTVLESGEEDDGELQPFGRVQRHERDLTQLGIGDLIGVRGQRHLFEELVDGCDSDAGSRGSFLRRGGGSVVRFRVGVRLGCRGGLTGGDEVLGHGDEFGEVVHPRLVLRIGALLQRFEIAGLFEDRLDHPRQRGRFGGGGEVLHEIVELLHRGQSP